jgi:hypothetical protein
VTLEHEVREAMAEAVQHVRPAPDPLARLLSRKRRTRRFGWTAAAGVVAATGAAFALGGVVSTADRVDPAPPPTALTEWSRRMLASPPRGSLAADETFLEQLRAATGPAPRVLLADEIGDQRIAIVSTTGQLRFFVGPRGGTIASLTAKPTVLYGPFVEPFITAFVDGVAVQLAPSGCQVATAALPEATDWRPAPTGSYLVRTGSNPAEWWRVTCDGQVKFEGPAHDHDSSFATGDPLPTASATEISAATRDARGSVDADVVTRAYQTFADAQGDRLTDRPRLVWGGRLDGGKAAVLAAPAVGGGWWAGLAYSGENGGMDIDSFHTMSDPFVGAPVTATPEADGTVLVVAPENATQAQLTLDGRTVVSGPLSDGVGLLYINRASLSEADRLRSLVETADEGGKPVASGPVDDGPPARDVIDRWDS